VADGRVDTAQWQVLLVEKERGAEFSLNDCGTDLEKSDRQMQK